MLGNVSKQQVREIVRIGEGDSASLYVLQEPSRAVSGIEAV
jgi:hypothetical protein